MNRVLVRVAFFSICLAASVSLLSCGASSNRMLESISISPAAAHGQNGPVQFVATGTFSAPPITVTPLNVNWSAPTMTAGSAACAIGACPSISRQGLAICGTSPAAVAVTAVAPADPRVPLNSQGVPVVIGRATLVCP